MTIEHTLYSELKFVKELVYDTCGLEFSNLKLNPESVEYGACSFELKGQKVVHRISKITPTKTGQFVTIWKRNNKGITEPYDVSDDFNFIIITSKSGANFGQFIFPKSLLAEKGIVSQNGKNGERGIRVYPPWDTAMNKQAEKTQAWQTKYFVHMSKNNAAEQELITKLLDNK